jgi:hypothetical protein
VNRVSPPRPLGVQERIIRTYVSETKDATFWAKPPVIFPPAVRYLHMHFRDFDPRRPHVMRESRFKLWIPELVHLAPSFSGVAVQVVGQIVQYNLLGPVPGRPHRLGGFEWVLQLEPITVEDGLVYCRVTEPLRWHPVRGRIMIARGVVLASGGIDLARGGMENGAYLACSAVAPAGGRWARYVETHPREQARIKKLIARGGDLTHGQQG